MRTPRPLIAAWVWLCALSVVSTALSVLVAPRISPAVAGIAILAFAWVKARMVIARYMGLADAPAWQRGFDLTLALFVGLLAALYLVPLIDL